MSSVFERMCLTSIWIRQLVKILTVPSLHMFAQDLQRGPYKKNKNVKHFNMGGYSGCVFFFF